MAAIHQGKSARGADYAITVDWQLQVLGYSSPITGISGCTIHAGCVEHKGKRTEFRCELIAADAAIVQAAWDAAHPKRMTWRDEQPEAAAEYARIIGMFERAESLRDWPGSYFPALQKAQAAMAEWRAKFPAAAKAEDERDVADRKAEDERREREYKRSFIGRGID